MNVKIKLIEGGKMPERKTKGAAAFDCYARIEDGFKLINGTTIVPLGFALELPEGYCAKILLRSGIGAKTPIRMANSLGLIDSDFRGEVSAILECHTGVFRIENGERIAQMVIERVEPVTLEVVDELSETERGANGFGSTGAR